MLIKSMIGIGVVLLATENPVRSQVLFVGRTSYCCTAATAVAADERRAAAYRNRPPLHLPPMYSMCMYISRLLHLRYILFHLLPIFIPYTTQLHFTHVYMHNIHTYILYTHTILDVLIYSYSYSYIHHFILIKQL